MWRIDIHSSKASVYVKIIIKEPIELLYHILEEKGSKEVNGGFNRKILGKFGL